MRVVNAVSHDPAIILNTLLVVFNGILVLFNGILALCTWKLVSSTDKLWSAADAQARSTQQSIDLTRSEFLATHRPRLRVRVVKLGETVIDSIKIQYTIINVGETPAKMTLHKTTTIAQAADGGVIPSSIHDEECVRLTGGEAKILQTRVIPDFDTSFDLASGGAVIFRGIIEYVDDVGVKRRTGFLRTYKLAIGRFVADTDLNEEYED
jgi:hypothetical protein